MTSDSGGELASGGRPSRSYENLGPGQQRYRVIEQCNDSEALFAKIESGHYDWLGVQEKKGRQTYILGRPAVSRGGVWASSTALHHSADGTAPTGQHRVSVRVPQVSSPSESWWTTPEEARIDFLREVRELEVGSGSGLYRVTLVVDGHVDDEKFVVRASTNRI